MIKSGKFSIEQVVTLDIDATGGVTQRLTNLETTLENTLLNALYPGIKVAVVNVPREPLDAYEESLGTFTTATLIPGYSAFRRVFSSVVSRFVSL
jgi:hypothetical protein